MEFEVVRGSVVNANADVIVNAANINLYAGGGVCGAIFDAAGRDELQRECNMIGYCETGNTVITKGYNLQAKYIIHAVGPVYSGSEDDGILLASTYKNSLMLADKYNLESIAFPCISTGIYGFPLVEASKIAISVVKNYKPINNLKKVYFYCFTDKEYEAYLKNK